MANLLMVTGLGSVEGLVRGKRGAFYNTLEEFHKYWDRIDIIAPKILKGSTSKSQEEVEPLFGNVFIHVSPYPLILHPLFFIRKGISLNRLYKFSLMTVQDFPPFYNGIGAKILHYFTHVPYVLEIMHVPGFPRAASLQESIYRILTKLFIAFDARTARMVRVINQKQVSGFLIRAGVSKNKIKYIPANYIDLDIFRPHREIEKKYDLVFAARLEKNKGINLLIEAIKIAARTKPDISLLIIGSGPLKDGLRLKVECLKLGNNIVFSDWLETPLDVAQTYNLAKILVNPSFNEGGPRVALEAMACGLPVITTHVGVMEDIIQDGENGLFIDWNPEDIARKILKLLNDKEMQNKFSKAGQEIAKQFERKKAIENYAQSLKSIIND